jgi:hypothetical protein
MKRRYMVTSYIPQAHQLNTLGRAVRPGEAFYANTKPTYGCISPQGVALTEKWATGPFFELPAAHLSLVVPHVPMRGSDVEAWIKANRDSYGSDWPEWFALDLLLDNYRLKADTGASLEL